MAQFGSAGALGALGRRFESCRHPPQSTNAICSLLSWMSFPLGNGKGRCPCDLTPPAGNHLPLKRRERAVDRYKQAPLSDEPSLLQTTSSRSDVGIRSVQLMNTCLWATIQEAAEALGLSVTRLRQLQAKGRLQPGVHWVYLTGTKGGPVGWSIMPSGNGRRSRPKPASKQNALTPQPLKCLRRAASEYQRLGHTLH